MRVEKIVHYICLIFLLLNFLVSYGGCSSYDRDVKRYNKVWDDFEIIVDQLVLNVNNAEDAYDMVEAAEIFNDKIKTVGPPLVDVIKERLANKKVGKDVSFRDAVELARKNTAVGRKLRSLSDKITEYENDPISEEAIQELIENTEEIKYWALKSLGFNLKSRDE